MVFGRPIGLARAAPQDRADMLGRVEGIPGGLISLLPLPIRHLGVVGDAVVEVIFVEVTIHPDALLQKHLVVFGAGKRREEEKFEEVERQLALDDLDVVKDRFLRIGRKAEDVARIGDGAVVAPFLQHLAIFGDLVLPLLGRDQIVGIDVLEPDEDAAHARFLRLLDEVRDLVAKRVDLDGEAEIQPSFSRISMIRSKSASQLRLRAKLSSVMKKRLMPCA